MKTARRIFFVLCAMAAAVGGIIGLWYAVVNYQGAKHWADTRHLLEARGESFDLARLIPPPVPDDQNLALSPFFKRLYQYRVDPATGVLTFNEESYKNAVKTTGSIPFGAVTARVSGGSGWSTGRALDLAEFQHFYRARPDFPRAPAEQTAAEDVLLALTRFGPLLDELTQTVAAYPQARFPVNYTQRPAAGISLPHYSLVQQFTSLLRLRACALLATGQTDLALRDIALASHLLRAISPEPTLLCGVVSATCEGLLMQPVWEGLQARHWNAAQLAQLQATLSDVDDLTAYRRSMQAERVSSLLPVFDYMHQGKLDSLTGESTSPSWASFAYQLCPRGWFDEGKALACRLNQRYMIDTVDVAHHRIDAQQCEAGDAIIQGLPVRPISVIARISLSGYGNVVVKIAHAQTITDQAIVACALERYYLDRSSYPAGLEALTPTYLARVPTDVIDGAPLRYELTGDGRYRLWSVGWNGRDEHGEVVWSKGNTKLDDKHGDWVWQYTAFPLPANTPPGK